MAEKWNPFSTPPGASAVGDSITEGTDPRPARADHKHGREAFATPSIVLGSAAAAGSLTTLIRADATIAAFDTTNPTTSAVGDAVAIGTAAFAARRDHTHGREGFAAPNTLALGTAAANGSLATLVRSDATILAFDATNPAASAVGDTAVVGVATVASRRDHRHAREGATTVLFLTEAKWFTD